MSLLAKISKQTELDMSESKAQKKILYKLVSCVANPKPLLAMQRLCKGRLH